MGHQEFIERNIQKYLVERFGDMPPVQELAEKGSFVFYQMGSKAEFLWEDALCLSFDLQFNEDEEGFTSVVNFH